MIIERADRLLNICEIKYTQSEYTITTKENRRMRSRIAAFIRETKNTKGVIPTWITLFGLFPNEQAATVTSQVTMDDLFHE